MNKKGQAAGILAFVVGIIILVAVAIPVTTSVISDANLSGTTATVVGFIPLFLGLVGLVGAAALMGFRK